MSPSSFGVPRQPTARDLAYLSKPALWPHWPLLPVVRRSTGGAVEFGLLFDLFGALDLAGYSSTVFLTTMYLLPKTLDGFWALPQEVFESPEEVAAAGWVID